MKELHGDKLPDDAFEQIEKQLNCPCEETLEDIQYLLWLSMLKKDKDATFEQISEWIDANKVEEYSAFMVPDNIAEKKRQRSPVKKKKVKKKVSR